MIFANVTGIAIPEGAVSKITDAAGTVLWKKPSAYTFVKSLNISSLAVLDTGAACKSTDYMSIDFAIRAASTYGAVVHAGKSKIMRFYMDGTKLQAKVDWYNQAIATVSAGTRYQVHLVGQKAFLNGAQVVDMSGVPSFTADTNVIIGGIGHIMRLWGVKHGTDANKLDRDMVPAVRNSDQTAGLYDRVSKKFYPYGSAN